MILLEIWVTSKTYYSWNGTYKDLVSNVKVNHIWSENYYRPIDKCFPFLYKQRIIGKYTEINYTVWKADVPELVFNRTLLQYLL